MAKLRGDRVAFGWPGLEPRWTQADKDGVGTAYAADSRVWYTVGQGILNEIYYPTIDSPQTRDLQYLITDGKTFFQGENRDLDSKVERLSRQSLGYLVTSSDPMGRYVIRKEIIASPHLPCVIQHTEINGDAATIAGLRFYTLCAPHLCTGGWGNNGYVMEAAGRQVLAAERHGRWLVLAADVPFSRLSCGYVGRSDGWTDLADNLQMDWEFDRAPDGNVALIGEVDLEGGPRFTVGIAFGETFQSAVTALFQSLAVPFESHKQRFTRQWARACEHSSNATSKRGRPRQKVRWSQKSAGISSGFALWMSTISIRRRAPIAPSSTSATNHRTLRGSSQPERSSMPVFWNSCGTGSAGPEIPSLKTRSVSSTPFSKWIHRSDRPGAATTLTDMDSAKTEAHTINGERGGRGRY